MLIASTVPAVRVTIQLRDTSTQVKAPRTVVDLDIKNLSHTISITNIKATLYIGRYINEMRRFERLLNFLHISSFKKPLFYYDYPIDVSHFIEADKNDVLRPFDFGDTNPGYSVVSSIEDFLVEKLPQLLQEHKVTIGHDLQPIAATGGPVQASIPIIEHQYHHARAVWVKAVATYRAEVGGTSKYRGKKEGMSILVPYTEDGETKLKGWNAYS